MCGGSMSGGRGLHTWSGVDNNLHPSWQSGNMPMQRLAVSVLLSFFLLLRLWHKFPESALQYYVIPSQSCSWNFQEDLTCCSASYQYVALLIDSNSVIFVGMFSAYSIVIFFYLEVHWCSRVCSFKFILVTSLLHMKYACVFVVVMPI